jgi:hypothetical protein
MTQELHLGISQEMSSRDGLAVFVLVERDGPQLIQRVGRIGLEGYS